MLNPCLSPLLTGIPGLKHGFFTRQGGVSLPPFNSLNMTTKYGDQADHVLENKKRVEAYLQGSLVTTHQVHGSVIHVLESITQGLQGDGLTTQIKGCMVGVLTADCVPVLWVDPVDQRIMALHCGWRGVAAGIVEKGRALFKHAPYVAIGPSIQQCSFEVGPEVKAVFCARYAWADAFFQGHETGFFFDLPGLIIKLLKNLNIREIDWIADNTYSQEDKYFSYRKSCHQKQSQFGVMVSALGWPSDK